MTVDHKANNGENVVDEAATLEAAEVAKHCKPSSRPTALRRAASILGTLSIAVVMIAAAAGGITALQIRAGAEPARERVPPVSVRTIVAEIIPHYERRVDYTGRLEARRQTQLSFERSGTVIEIALDEGQRVSQGDVVARLDTAQLRAQRRQLEARRRELQAARDLARLTLNRQSKLQRRGWSPEQRMDEARASLAQLTASIDQVAAQLAANSIDLRKSVLLATFGGTVGTRSIDEGTVVAPGTPILNLIETENLQVRIGLPPNAARNLKMGTRYDLNISGQPRSAELLALRPDLATGTRTVTALFNLGRDNVQLPIGDLVTITLRQRVEEAGAWMPLTALKEGRRGLWSILVVDDTADQPLVVAETVELLYAEGERAYVRGTFKPGARVLSEGTDRVVSGQRVALAGEVSQ